MAHNLMLERSETNNMRRKVDRILIDTVYFLSACDMYMQFYDEVPLLLRTQTIMWALSRDAGSVDLAVDLSDGVGLDIPGLTSNLDSCILRLAQLKELFLQIPDYRLPTEEKRDRMRREMEALANSWFTFRRIHFLLDEIEARAAAFSEVNSVVRGRERGAILQ